MLIKKEENVNTTQKKSLKIIKGSIIALILTIIMLTIYAALLANTNISENTMLPVLIGITGVSILIGSAIISTNIKKNGIINGALVGLIYILSLYILSSILTGIFILNINSIILIIVCILTGMIGGIVGVNMK